MKELKAVDRVAYLVTVDNNGVEEFHVAIGDYNNAIGLRSHLHETEGHELASMDVIPAFLWGFVESEEG